MRNVILALFSLLTVSLIGQTNDDELLFRNSVEVLASDSFGGRKPMTKHETLTVNYIADQFKSLGLQPLNGDSYSQNVPLVEIASTPKNNEIVVKGKKGTVLLKHQDDFVFWSRRVREQVKVNNADFVFAGFGINAPEYGWNDYDGLDVKGKIVVVLVNDPGFYNEELFRGKNMTYYGRWVYKCEEAARQGAIGVLIIHETSAAAYGWDVVRSTWGRVNLNLHNEDDNLSLCAIEGWISGQSAEKLFDIAGVSYKDAVDAAKKKGFKAIDLNFKSTIEYKNEILKGQSTNVAGVLPGTDLKDEYIIYTAHWDHFGYGEPLNGDSIYNGAIDNATGVAGLFVIANRFRQLENRPRRSVIFLSVTAEEAVLLGSEYYCKHPLVPLNKTVANINMDSFGPSERVKDVIVTGKGDSETDRYVIEAAAAQGRVVKPVANASGGGYYRSDHFNFAKVGVPVVVAKGGSDLLDSSKKPLKLKESTYHKPTDEYDPSWVVSGTLENLYLLYGIGLRLANESYFPKWNDGVQYKYVREKSL